VNEIQIITEKIIDLPDRPPFMLDSDLADLYETKTKKVNQAVRRNPDRFPSDFYFQISNEEVKEIANNIKATNCGLKFGTHGGRRYLPYGFTREGCNMLSTVLRSPIAIKRSIQIMRAFSSMEVMATDDDMPFEDDAPAIDPPKPPVADAPDVAWLPSGLQLMAIKDIYGVEGARLILAEHCGIYPGIPKYGITHYEAKVVRKSNPNKRQRDEMVAWLVERGMSKEQISIASGLSKRCIYLIAQRVFKGRNV
jgi:hypothetical protein